MLQRYFIKAIDPTFYGLTGVITHLGCWKNTRKACESRAESRLHHSHEMHLLPEVSLESLVYDKTYNMMTLYERS